MAFCSIVQIDFERSVKQTILESQLGKYLIIMCVAGIYIGTHILGRPRSLTFFLSVFTGTLGNMAVGYVWLHRKDVHINYVDTITSVIAAKQTILNKVYGGAGSIKYRYCDILLKKHILIIIYSAD